MTAHTDEDEERWAEAEALLARWRPEPVDRRLARERQNQRVLTAGFVLAGVALALALVLLAVDPPPHADDAPTWRVVTGLTVSVIGLVFLVVGAGFRVPARRAPLAWGRPLQALNRRQRRELLRQVRGRTPVVPERIPLARHVAETLLDQQSALHVQTSLLVSFIGLFIVGWSIVGTLYTVGMTAAVAAGAVQGHRDRRRLHRFLDAHPAPPGG